MDARRARHLVVTMLSASLVLPVLVTPVAAATCKLAAPGTVAIGSPSAITGSGFPASSNVDIVLTFEGSPPAPSTAQSDARGAFVFNVTPTAADAGRATVAATAGTSCTAQVAFTVGVSIGTAGAGAEVAGTTGSGPDQQAPPTDAEQAGQGEPSGPASATWLLALLLLLLGLAGRLTTVPTRRP